MDGQRVNFQQFILSVWIIPLIMNEYLIRVINKQGKIKLYKHIKSSDATHCFRDSPRFIIC